jgi:site-specific recombinase
MTKDLRVLLGRMAEISPSHAERSAWLEELGSWLHGGFGRVSDDDRTNRLRDLISALDSVEDLREDFAALLTGVVSELRGTKLFADVGIPVESGFWREAVDRISRTVLPTPPAPKSFAEFIEHLFPTVSEARWLERCPPELWAKLWSLLETTKAPLSAAWIPLAGSMSDAMRILAARIAALGVAQDIRDRLPGVTVSQLPFLRLPPLCDALQLGPRRLSMSTEGVLSVIAECRAALQQVHAHVEEFGVSVDLVFRIELMTAQLARLEQLVELFVPHDVDALARNLGRFGLSLVHAQFQGRSVLDLLKSSSHLLARKVVERSGKSGEHYITETSREWRAMLVSAAGGGFLTTFTAAFKLLTAALALPIFFASAVACVNYAGSFLLMGAVGFTLATKQPSMTAAALAASLDSQHAHGEGKAPSHSVEKLVTLMAQISRSQLAAAIGNLGMVIPTALAFDLLWRRITGHPFLAPDKATHVIESLHPLRSGTLPYAALTGVLLWLSSLGAGWLENWIAYRRIPDALAHHRGLRRLLGPERAKRLAGAVAGGAASVGGSVTLGCLLGIVPTLGVFFGLPLNVRHVTLSTGSLAFAGSALGAEAIGSPDFLFAIAGIFLIGALNFGVSFVLALAVALRASDRWRLGTTSIMGEVATALAKRVFRNPLEFLFPPRSIPKAKETA